MNWLDRENPQAGGAELHFFEVFRRLVARGHEVTLVASGFRGAAPRVELDGIAVRRFGGRHGFAWLARGALKTALREKAYDLVVEDVNKLPLYVPTLTRLPVYVIVPHLFGVTAFREASWPVATVVWLAEQAVPAVYRGSHFHAISESTRGDLERRGVDPARIRVIHPGVDAVYYAPDHTVARAATPTFLYVGRLKRYKGLETALRAAAVARNRGVALRLDLAGEGDDRRRLERLASRLRLEGSVRFLGFVTDQRKRALMRAAWAVVFPSEKEGWGITNVEAAACGTPVIASDSPGLRESVRPGETGVLVPHGDPEALAEALVRFARDPQLVVRYGTQARRFAEGFSWDAAAAATEAHLLDVFNAA